MLHKSSGKISMILLLLAIVLLVVIVIVYGVIQLNAVKNKQAGTQENQAMSHEPQKPMYEVMLGDIRFVLQSSEDLGPVLKSPVSYQQDLKTTERFIKVTVAAQNKGKNNTRQSAWEVGNIVDSEGRNFIASNKTYYFLPRPDLCGAVLEPEFEPTPCIRIYEVSKESTGLKVEVKVSDPKKQTASLDLKLY